MIHEEFVGGENNFEIDHHFPQSKGGPRSLYHNLFLSCPRCNRNKGDEWPEKAARDAGIRYLNPCIETDYGEQIFENDAGELVPVTRAAEYHIEMLSLNRRDLLRSRKKRKDLAKELIRLRTSGPIRMNLQNISRLTEALDLIKSGLENRIPAIPPPPVL